jgi:hypothetical protein
MNFNQNAGTIYPDRFDCYGVKGIKIILLRHK